MSSNRNRRSSILKPSKTRNPLSDINLDQPFETTSRRVSFATSNFIKEFTADPEKNTIWHTSYEEAASSTDPAASEVVSASAVITQESPENAASNMSLSEDILLTDYDDFNCTKIGSFDDTLEEHIVVTNELQFNESLAISNINMSHQPTLPSFIMNQEINYSIMGHSVHVNQSTVRDHVMHPTQEISAKRRTIHFNQQSNDCDMDITQSSPLYISNSAPETKRRTLVFSRGSNDCNMDMTQVISQAAVETLDKENVPSLKRQTIHFQQFATNEDDDMEMTETMPAGMKVVDNEKESTKWNTIHFDQVADDGNMEMTQSIPVGIKIMNEDNVSNTKRNTIHFNQVADDGNMEMTQSIPVVIKIMNEDNVSNTKMNTIHFNQVADDDNMEMTQSIPAELKIVLANTNREKVPEIKRRTIHFNQDANDGDMELTQYIPVPKDVPNVDFSGQPNNIVRAAERIPGVVSTYYSDELTKSVPSGSSLLQSGQTFLDEETAVNEDICIRIQEYPDQSPNCSSFLHSSKFNLTPAPAASIHNQTSFNLSRNLSSYIDNTERLINYKTDGKPTSDYSKIINDDLELSTLKHINLSRNASCQMQEISSRISGVCNVKEVKATAAADTSLCTVTGSTICNTRLSDEMIIINDVNDIPNRTTTDVCKHMENDDDDNDLPTNTASVQIIFGDSIDISENIDCDKNESVVLVNSSTESECDMSNDNNNEDTTLDLYLIYLREHVVTSPCIKDLINTSDLDTSGDECEPFARKSMLKSVTILDESLSLVESFSGSDCSGDFAAVKSGAKQVKRLINKSVVDSDEMIKEKSEYNIDRVKEMLNKLFTNIKSSVGWNTVPEVNQELTLEEKIKEKSRDAIWLNTEPEVKRKLTLEEKIKEKSGDAIWLNTEPEVKRKLTLEEKIKEKSRDAMWCIVKLHHSEPFKFTFMFETIELVVDFDRDTDIVTSTQVFSCFCESTSHPRAIYINGIVKKKLSQAGIKSACGEIYSILSLLDYLTIVGEQMIDILGEFGELEMNYGLAMDTNLNVTVRLNSFHLRVIFAVTFNLSNIDNMSENDVSVHTELGNVREIDVKRLAKDCSSGLPFIRAYIRSLKDYLRIMEKYAAHPWITEEKST